MYTCFQLTFKVPHGLRPEHQHRPGPALRADLRVGGGGPVPQLLAPAIVGRGPKGGDSEYLPAH